MGIVVAFDIGIKNLAVCILDVGEKTDEAAHVVIWKVIALAETKEKIPCVQELSERLFIALDELMRELEEKGHDTVDNVLIENQPSRLNGAMKSIQMMVYSYFQLRKHWEGKVNNTYMVSASQKLLYHKHEIPDAPAGKTGYALNKWKAIQYGMQYIKDDASLLEYINKHKKKDDAFDSLLHAVSWLKKQSYLIEKIAAPL